MFLYEMVLYYIVGDQISGWFGLFWIEHRGRKNDFKGGVNIDFKAVES